MHTYSWAVVAAYQMHPIIFFITDSDAITDPA
jgi:hypothetical protein